jgi:hypothetical protein
MPPSAAGEVVVEQLGQATLVWPEGMHIVVIPQLMMGWGDLISILKLIGVMYGDWKTSPNLY